MHTRLPDHSASLPVSVGMFAAFLVAGAILFPVFVKAPSNSYLYVYDARGKPVPRARLTFFDPRDHRERVCVTDDHGVYAAPKLNRFAAQVHGEYALQAGHHNTGYMVWVYSPRGTQCFTFSDGAGRRFSHLQVQFSESYATRDRGYRHRASPDTFGEVYETDASGTISFPNIALAGRVTPRIVGNALDSRQYVVKSVAVHTGVRRVGYDVRVDPVATIRGAVICAGGTVGTGHVVTVSPIPFAPDNGDRTRTTTTHTSGRFMLTGFASGNYLVRARDLSPTLRAGSPSAPIVALHPGETKNVPVRVP